jgi:hypothetical protein
MPALGEIAAVAMAPDASWAVAVAGDGTVRTLGTGVAPGSMAIDPGGPVAVALSGERLRVLWAAEGTIRLRESAGGTRPRDEVFAAPALVRALALSPSGGTAVVACDDGSLRFLDPGTGEFGSALATEGLTARAVAVASDQGPVVAAFPDGSVRRYDLAPGTSQTVGICPGVRLVAVTPDGGTVVAAGAVAVLFRWKQQVSLADLREVGTPATALAIDGTGDKVLAGAATGELWLHDFTGGPATEFGAEPASPVPGDFRGIVDEDVRFTVYRPLALPAGVWASLLVFAHKTDLVEQPGRAPLDPVRQVERMARAHFGDTPVRQGSQDARGGVFRGARLRVAADLPGITCNPGDAEFDWREPVHQVLFRLLAGPELVGSVVRGAVRIWCGPLLLGEVSLAISVTAGTPGAESPAVPESAPRYRKIFPSYSHDDRAIVDGFAEAVRALGDEWLQDVLAIRSGEIWRARLMELIDEADIFQLFWSSNSMRSSYCREEWEHALALGRPLFVRPLYWEDPMPEDPAQGLPPAALSNVQFIKVRPYSVPGGTPARPAAAPSPVFDVPAGGPAPPAPPAPVPPAGQGPAGQPSDGRPPPSRTSRPVRKRGGLVGAIAATGVAAAIAVAATSTGLFVGSSKPGAIPSQSATVGHPATPPPLAAGVLPLSYLLPRDIFDPATQCTTMRPPFQWEMPGLVQALACTAPGLPGGQVYGFQMNSHANFETAWRNFNKWWGITGVTPGPSCPPRPGGAGRVGFHNEFFPPRAGQVLECQTVGSGSGAQPAYAWAYPTEDAFLVAQGAPGSSFAALDSWWANSALGSPTPSPAAS